MIRFLLVISLMASVMVCQGQEHYLKYIESEWELRNKGPLLNLRNLLHSQTDNLVESTNGRHLFNFFSQYMLAKPECGKTDVSLVFIHGLFGNSDQFQGVAKNLFDFESCEFSAILLTLPGHPQTSEGFTNINEEILTKFKFSEDSLSKAKIKDWLDAVQSTLQIAKQISKKTIVVGQSTGGLLAAYFAYHHPNLIDGLLLQEPAFKVRFTPKLTAKMGRVPLVGSLNQLIASLFIDQPKERSQLGSQVIRLSNQEFAKKTKSISKAAAIHQPVSLIYWPRDKVVSNQSIDLFYQNLPNPIFKGINFNSTASGHGTSATYMKDSIDSRSYAIQLCMLITKVGKSKKCKSLLLNWLNEIPSHLDRAWATKKYLALDSLIRFWSKVEKTLLNEIPNESLPGFEFRQTLNSYIRRSMADNGYLRDLECHHLSDCLLDDKVLKQKNAAYKKALKNLECSSSF